MTTRKTPDLAQIRPSAELDPPSIRHAPASGGPAPSGREPPHYQNRRSRTSGRRARQAQSGEPWSIGAKIAVFFGLLVGVPVVLGGLAIAVLFFVFSPTDLVRNELIRQVKANTGRTLQINGHARFVFYPSLGVSLGNVVLSGPPDMATEATLSAKRLDLKLALLALIQRRVRIEHVGLVEPVVNLLIDKQGRQSWQFAGSTDWRPSQRVQVAQIGTGLGTLSDTLPAANSILRTAAPAAAGAYLEKLELRSLALEKAVLQYRDARDGSQHMLRDLDLQLKGRRISDPLRANGELIWQGEKISFRGQLDTLSQLLTGKNASVRFNATGQPFTAGFDGTIKIGETIDVAGQTRASSASVAQLSRWLGMEFPNAGPLGGFSVSGQLVGDSKAISLNGAELRLGEAKGSGTILLALRVKRPYISADLKWSELDIDRLSAGFSDSRSISLQQQQPVSTSRPASQKPPNQEAPQSIEDLLRRSQPPESPRGAGRFAPQVRGYTNRNEWSAEPISADVLGLIDAKARLRFDALKAGGLSITRAITRLDLTDSVARLDIDDLDLYQGVGKGVITVRAANAKSGAKGVVIGANLRVEKVGAKALLSDAAGFQRLDGRGAVVLVASSAGNSQKAIAESLNGTASFELQDGAVVGWNISKILEGLQKGQFSQLDANPAESTEFSALSASFNIVDGTATTDNLKMVSPVLQLTGTGTVGIGARNLNLALRPELASLSRGQRGPADGFAIPVRLKGPWHDPQILPDIGGLTKNPDQLLEKAQELGRQYKGKSIGDIVRGVLGDGDRGDVETGRTNPNKDTKDILKQFWK